VYAEENLKAYSLRRVYRFIQSEETSFTKFACAHCRVLRGDAKDASVAAEIATRVAATDPIVGAHRL